METAKQVMDLILGGFLILILLAIFAAVAYVVCGVHSVSRWAHRNQESELCHSEPVQKIVLELKEAKARALHEARHIQEKTTGRNPTAEERASIQRAMMEARRVHSAIETIEDLHRRAKEEQQQTADLEALDKSYATQA